MRLHTGGTEPVCTMWTVRKETTSMPIRSFALAALVLAVTAARPAASAPANTLAGTWKVAVTLVDCSSGTPVAPSFTSLLAFAGDGVESETTNNPALQPGQRSPAFGVWKHTGSGQYHLDTTALILFASTMPHPISAGSQQIHQDIAVSGNSFTSAATIQFYDTTGAATSSGCATAAATRLG